MAKYTSLAEAQKAAEEAQAAVEELRGQSVERIEELVRELNMIILDLKQSGRKSDIRRAKEELDKLSSFVEQNFTEEFKDSVVKDAFHAVTPDKNNGYPQSDLMKYIRKVTNRPTMARNTMLNALMRVAEEHRVQTPVPATGSYSTKVYWNINKAKTKGWFKDTK